MTIKPLDIVKFREKAKLTQGELADKLGVSERTIQNYEAGKKIPASKYEIFHRIFRETNSGLVDNSDIYINEEGDIYESGKQPREDLTDQEADQVIKMVRNNWMKLMSKEEFSAFFYYKAALWADKYIKNN